MYIMNQKPCKTYGCTYYSPKCLVKITKEKGKRDSFCVEHYMKPLLFKVTPKTTRFQFQTSHTFIFKPKHDRLLHHSAT